MTGTRSHPEDATLRSPGVRPLTDALPGDPDVEQPPLTLARWIVAIIERWRLVLVVTGLSLLAAVAAVLVLPASYQSTGSFVSVSAGGLKLPGGGLGAAGGLMTIASQLGVTPPGSDPTESANFYHQLIYSRELRTRLAESEFIDPRPKRRGDTTKLVDILVDTLTIAERLGLRERDAQRHLEIVLDRLRTSVIGASFDPKTNLVSISVKTRWPELSAAVTNRIIALVGAFNLEQRVSRAKAKRVFIEGRLAASQSDLAESEARLRDFYTQNRLWKSSPSLMYDEGRLRRQTEIANEMYLTLRREFETARIAEVNDAAVITVVDSGVAPRRPTWPRFGPVFVTACLLGVALGLLIAGTAAVWQDWMVRNPEAAAGLKRAAATMAGEWRLFPASRTRRRLGRERDAAA